VRGGEERYGACADPSAAELWLSGIARRELAAACQELGATVRFAHNYDMKDKGDGPRLLHYRHAMSPVTGSDEEAKLCYRVARGEGVAEYIAAGCPAAESDRKLLVRAYAAAHAQFGRSGYLYAGHFATPSEMAAATPELLALVRTLQ
jgi:hypothetical protein